MIDVLPYILKSTAYFTICFAFYYFVLRKENALIFNRFYLIVTIFLSLLMPLLSITIALPEAQSLLPLKNESSVAESVIVYTTTGVAEGIGERKNDFNILFCLAIIYSLVSIVLLIRFLVNLGKIASLKRKGRNLNYRGCNLILALSKIAPHSFMKYIFLNEADFENGFISDEIILHEKAHCDQLHSLDIIFIEIVKVFFWWNPIIWMYKRNMQMNHEYLADQSALQKVNTIDYQKAILHALENTSTVALVSHFNYYSIKNRFKMMTTQKMNATQKISKALMFLPILIILFAFSVNIEAQEVEQKKKAVKTTKEIQEAKQVKVVLEDENLSEKEINEIIEKELEKHDLEGKEIDVDVQKENGITSITINGKQAVFMELDEGNKKNKTKIKVINGAVIDSDSTKWIVKESMGEDVKIEKLLKDFDIDVDVKNIGRSIKIMEWDEEDGAHDMEKLELYLEGEYGINDKVIKIIEEEIEKEGENEAHKVIIKKVDGRDTEKREIRIVIEEESNKKKKKRKKRK